MKPLLFLPVCLWALSSCDRPSASPAAPAPVAVAAAPAEEPWIAGNALGDWQPLEAASQAPVKVLDGVLHLSNGDGVSGVKYVGKRPLPVVDYEISWEAMKEDGADFFGAATFPVRDLKTCVTFVTGGWGGGVTGISCINSMSAEENNTTSGLSYVKGQWYRFRVQITDEILAAWVDDAAIFKVSIKGKQVGMRIGDIEGCVPLGFATYMTKGQVRNLHFRKLAAGELKSDLDTF